MLTMLPCSLPLPSPALLLYHLAPGRELDGQFSLAPMLLLPYQLLLILQLLYVQPLFAQLSLIRLSQRQVRLVRPLDCPQPCLLASSLLPISSLSRYFLFLALLAHFAQNLVTMLASIDMFSNNNIIYLTMSQNTTIICYFCR